jgi:hypothetical protein
MTEVLAAAASPSGSVVVHVALFVLVSLVVALVTSAIRIGDGRHIAIETRKFFVTIILVIASFAVFVEALSWVFLRR